MRVIFVDSYDFRFLFCFHRLEYLFDGQSVWRGDKIMKCEVVMFGDIPSISE